MNEGRNKQIIHLRSQGATLQEIATKFGISRERVRQITRHDDRDRRYGRRFERVHDPSGSYVKGQVGQLNGVEAQRFYRALVHIVRELRGPNGNPSLPGR